MKTSKDLEPQLVAYVAGQLHGQAAIDLERRLADDPEARRRLDDLRARWARLDPPELSTGPPPELASEIMSAVRREPRPTDELSWFAAPTWAKAGSMASLALGIVLGGWPAFSGGGEPMSRNETAAVIELSGSASEAWEPTLVDAYWQVLESTGGRLDDGLEDGLP